MTRATRLPAPDQRDRVWVADITSIDTGEGWLYLAGLADACTHRCVGWQTSDSLDASLVARAWQKAGRDRRPGPGLLHHKGPWRAVCQRSHARAAGAKRGRRVDEPPGQRYDNAMIESFKDHAQSRVLPR